MNGLLTALASGVSAQKILDFITRKFPTSAAGISKALAAGLSAEKIVKFLAKDPNFDRLQQMQKQYPTDFASNPLVQAEETRQKGFGVDAASSLKRAAAPAVKAGLLAGAGLLGTYALSRALPTIAQQTMATTGLGPQAATATSPQDGQIETPALEQEPVKPPEPVTAAEEKVVSKEQETQKLWELAQKGKIAGTDPEFLKKANSLVKSGDLKSYDEFRNFRNWWKATEGQGRGSARTEFETFRRETSSWNKPNNENSSSAKSSQIGDTYYDKGRLFTITKIDNKTFEAKANDGSVRSGPISSLNEILKSNKPESQAALHEKPEAISKSKKQVMLPNGSIGEIESEKNGIAKINVDGEIKHRKLDELVEAPLPQRDLADLYDELNTEIERNTGEPISRNVSFAGYDPNTNELIYLPHEGAAYIYQDISPDDAKALTEILTTRKTTGENFIGAWKAGSKSPIGAAMSQLIKKLQSERGGKGKEYSRKFLKIYDVYEAAKSAKKAKFKEQKKHEKNKKQ